MLKEYSKLFGDIILQLFDMEMATWGLEGDEKNERLDLEDANSLSRTLSQASKMSEELGLDAALTLSRRMHSRANSSGYNKGDLHKDISDLRSRIEDQLSSRMFLFIKPGKEDYYQKRDLFGTEVTANFPKAISDIEDAGKCIALGLGTSAVMHLMRVIECGLQALAKAMKIPYAPSWGSYLKQIQDRIGAKYRTKGIQWKRDERYFRDISGDLLVVKQAFRNPTMHIERRYTTDEAEEIFTATRTLIRRLASRLDESGMILQKFRKST